MHSPVMNRSTINDAKSFAKLEANEHIEVTIKAYFRTTCRPRVSAW